MRILLITDSYPPLIGGATRAAQQIATAMEERGHIVCVVTLEQEGAPPAEREATGVVVRRLPGLTLRVPALSADPYRNNPPPYPDPELVLRVRRAVEGFRPDVVHSYGWLSYSGLAGLAGLDLPVLLSARDYGNVCALRTLLRHGDEICSGPAPLKCLECAGRHHGAIKGAVATAGVLTGRRLLRRQVTGLHSCSSFVQEVMHRHLLDDDWAQRVREGTAVDVVLHDWRDPETPDAPVDRAALASLPDEPFILFVGALRLIKGLSTLVAAYERLESPPPLVLIGSRAPDTPDLSATATVIEGVSHATVMAAWDRAQFGVFSSLFAEPLGNVIHEAMSRGRAVVGTRPGGHGEMIEQGVNGLLVPAGDATALARAMQTLIDDPALRQRMGAVGREKAEAFTAARVVPELERAYRDTIAAHRRGRKPSAKDSITDG